MRQDSNITFNFISLPTKQIQFIMKYKKGQCNIFHKYRIPREPWKSHTRRHSVKLWKNDWTDDCPLLSDLILQLDMN
jgi:hypothetical protein